MSDNPYCQPNGGMMGRAVPMIGSSDIARRHRIAPPEQCRDLQSKLTTLNRLIAAAELEYRTTIRDLDRLDQEGRFWMLVDAIHKTSLATLDLGAAIVETTGLKAGTPVRHLAEGTRTLSEAIGTTADVLSGRATVTQTARTVAQRVIAHVNPRSAGGAYVRGNADILLTGIDHVEAINQARGTGAAGSRIAESGIDTAAALLQRSAETVGTPTARRVGSTAEIARAMASYNRELAGVFQRREETSGGLRATRDNFRATMERIMTRYRRDVAEIRRQLSDECR